MLEVIVIDKDAVAAGLELASAALGRGELVCLPADTVYGLACVPGQPGALDALYRAKGREKDKPVALMFADIAQIEESLPDLPGSIRKLLSVLLPGPVTVILPAGARESRTLGSRGGGGIGARVVPPQLAGIYGSLPLPLALTSANRSGEAEPLELDEVPMEILDLCAVALDAGRCPVGRPTTVVDLRPVAEGSRARILREEALPQEEIEKLIGTCA